ncbi:MAG TPA: site-2 protease family protein [Candidatus Angelobacter sp.]|nr:site-2 protease family protein [Candidatus Angelobacter sp.]
MPDDLPVPQEYQLYDPEQQEIRVVVIQPPKRRYWLHILLFLATLLSTLCVGARLQYEFDHNLNLFPFSEQGYFMPWTWTLADWHRLFLGVPFSLCLLGILTAHEMGHYMLCVRRKVYATWPYFIPFPSLIGTMGAFIRIRSPIRNRRDLFDIGIAGPIAGFIVAVPVLIFALLACKPLTPETSDSAAFGMPLIFKLAHYVLGALGSHAAIAQLDPSQLFLHPTAIAAWVGMFATALNLIPGGQLDGGHIVFAIHPRLHRTASTLAILALLPLAWYFWPGWLLWAVVLRVTGRHPPVPNLPPLDGKRRWLAVFGLIMFALTFAYNPIHGFSIVDIIHQFTQPSK